jgi:peptidoglycan-associated lipoprotein
MIIRMIGLAAVVLLLAACSSAPPPAAGGPPSGVGGPGYAPGSQQDLAATAGDRVFFAYDQSDISSEGQQILQRQAEWLKRYPRVSVTIEGHCDERGTREYNLALGQECPRRPRHSGHPYPDDQLRQGAPDRGRLG